jgi:hypothetical protein
MDASIAYFRDLNNGDQAYADLDSGIAALEIGGFTAGVLILNLAIENSTSN